MKFTYKWLLDHLETNLSVHDIANKLTSLGIEIEELTDYSKIFNKIVIGHILKVEKHPNADKLQVCQVDIGNNVLLQIVCGAKNARNDLYVAVALPGAIIPINKTVLKKGKIRGIESQGMMCSAAELQLSQNDMDGILELPRNSSLGNCITDALYLDDVVFDVSITPNRADCFSVRGIARDLAAAGHGKLRPIVHEEEDTNRNFNKDDIFNNQKLPNNTNTSPSNSQSTVISILSSYLNSPVWDFTINNQISNDIELNLDTHNCNYFSTLAINDFTGITPGFIQARLHLIGQKLISCPVDIANYVCYDLGQPMHVFDLDKLPKSLFIRNAKLGEQIHTLNNKTETLNNESIVVADNNNPLTLAGIIGGASTAVSITSHNLLIESAYFNKVTIAKTGQLLNITTDARTRFERGVDPKNVRFALIYFAYLLKLANRNVKISSIKEVGILPENSKYISLTKEKFTDLTGFSQNEFQSAPGILQNLGCVIQQKTDTDITVLTPSWRHDLNIEEDLIEEVVRVIGLDKIISAPIPDNFYLNCNSLLINENLNRNPHTNTLHNSVDSANTNFQQREYIQSVPEANFSYIKKNHVNCSNINNYNAQSDTMRAPTDNDFTHYEPSNGLLPSDIDSQSCTTKFRYDQLIDSSTKTTFKYEKLIHKDNVGTQSLQDSITEKIISKFINALIYNGYFEVKTFTLTDKNTADLFSNIYIELQNALSNEFSVLRPTIMASHLKAIIQAQCRSQNEMKIFELGKQFNILNNDIQEENVLCATFTEFVPHRNWRRKSAFSIFDIKEEIESLLHLTCDTFKFINSANSFYHPGRCGSYIYQKDIVIAQFGELHPSILLKAGVKSKVMGFEIFTDRLPISNNKMAKYVPYSQYQHVMRDFSFIVDRDCTAEDVINTIKRLHLNEIRNINIFDVYTAPSIGANRKAIGVEIKIQSDKKTLVDSEINDISTAIVENIKRKCNGVLRS